MSMYQVIIPKPVQKQLDRLPEKVIKRILPRLLNLRNNPRPPGSIKLRGYQSEYRLRIGDYRVRYAIDDNHFIVSILHCKHRKDVYNE
jgi:mRNA interferase RelE/StbE